jgi:sensor domain CHASE-containing protein
MSGDLLVGAGVAVVSVIVWLIRLEGRINTQAALYENLAEDVTYIRTRIDTALNGHR